MKQRFRTTRRGGALVVMGIVLFVIVGFVGLAIDWGYMTWTAQKLQTAADGAALAGAQQVWWSHVDARNAAIDIASKYEAGKKWQRLERNLHNEDPEGDIVVGHYDTATGVFTVDDNHTIANAVRVIARRNEDALDGGLPLIFGPIFNKQKANVDRYAIAVALGGPRAASVIALNTNDTKSFYVWGNGYFDLGDGSAQVDSSHSTGAVFQGTSLTFIASQVDMVGAWGEPGNPDLNAVDLNPHEPYVPDPLAALPVPPMGPPMSPDIIDPPNGAMKVYEPGYYPKGLSLNNDDHAFLQPGIYILENGSSNKSKPAFDIRGQARLEGYGVMFYIKFGNVELNGGGAINLTPPASGDYQGIQFFQARNNKQEAHFNGNGLLTGTAAGIDSGAGSLYFPSATVKLNGTGDMYLESIIADKIEVGGDGRKTVTRGYDGRPPGEPVYLVK